MRIVFNESCKPKAENWHSDKFTHAPSIAQYARLHRCKSFYVPSEGDGASWELRGEAPQEPHTTLFSSTACVTQPLTSVEAHKSSISDRPAKLAVILCRVSPEWKRFRKLWITSDEFSEDFICIWVWGFLKLPVYRWITVPQPDIRTVGALSIKANSKIANGVLVLKWVGHCYLNTEESDCTTVQ